MTADAANAAKTPSSVTPPERPFGTGRKVRIETGSLLLRRPISPANVSAVASATAAPNMTRAMSFEDRSHISAARTAMRPFARTCIRSRLCPFFSETSAIFPLERIFLETFPTMLLETKNRRRSRKPPKPVDHRTTTPMTKAPAAPPKSRLFARYAATAKTSIESTMTIRGRGQVSENSALSRKAIIEAPQSGKSRRERRCCPDRTA